MKKIKDTAKKGDLFYVSVDGNIVVVSKRMFLDKQEAIDIADKMIKFLSEELQEVREKEDKIKIYNSILSVSILPLRVM